MPTVRAILVICGILTTYSITLADPGPVDSATDQKSSSAPDVDKWVAALDANDYFTRETASNKLYEIGLPAVPALSQAARSDRLEVATRSIVILARLLNSDDARAEDAAFSTLDSVAANKITSTAARAETVLAGYRQIRQARAVERMRELGATVVAANGVGMQVTIGAEWRGKNDDLQTLKLMDPVIQLEIFAESVDDQAIPHLVALKYLRHAKLYGTQISDAGADQLRQKLKTEVVDIRNGGLLGVGGTMTSEGCVVDTLQPDSAAQKAGLLPKDQIISMEGQPVGSFEQLTAAIAKKRAGDSISLVIVRDGEKLAKTAKLDRWNEKVNPGSRIQYSTEYFDDPREFPGGIVPIEVP
ncbi:MAG: PDZ domain-containing protein [Planctomycetota bacterium]|nr:PDZ domain-containing protein [Planctomycetota bacterium]